jgi:hypothetical protein
VTSYEGDIHDERPRVRRNPACLWHVCGTKPGYVHRSPVPFGSEQLSGQRGRRLKTGGWFRSTGTHLTDRALKVMSPFWTVQRL